MAVVKKQVPKALQTHGDTVALQMNPQEAQATAAFLKLMGGAGVQSPKTGLLQFYPRGAEGDGSKGDTNGAAGRDMGGMGGGQGSGDKAGPEMSPSDLRDWAPGTTDVPGNQTQIDKGKYDPDNIGRNEVMGYYGSPPTATQNAISKITNLFGIGYHPNAINVGAPGYNETQSRVSVDPLGLGLSLAGLANPAFQMASLGYKGLQLAGLGAPKIGFNLGGTMSGPSSPTGPQGPSNPGANGNNSLGNVQTQTAQAAAPANTAAPTQSAVAQLMQQYMPAQTINQQIPGLLDYSQSLPGYSYPWYAQR